MAATVSPWAKPGAWALDAEEHEAELQQQNGNGTAANSGGDLADFPSLAAAATKPKKKKGQTLSLAEFTTYSSAKPREPKGLTHEDMLVLPTGPRQRTAEELDRNRLGGGFKSYGANNRYGSYNSNGDESSNSRWGSSRGSDDSRRQGGFSRDSGRELAPSRADEIDNWAAAKKSTAGNGFERRGRGGFFDSQSKADESDSWVSNKSFGPTEGRGSGGGFERRGSFDSLSRDSPNGGGANSDTWGKKKEDTSGGPRPRLVLQPRTLPVAEGKQEAAVAAPKPKGGNPFGEARPREEVLAEKGKDWKEIDEKLESMKIKEAVPEKEGSFGKRSFGIGNGRANLADDRPWRKSETVDSRPQSSGNSENGNAEEN